MSAPRQPGTNRQGSELRLIAGIVLLVVALGVAGLGFTTLVRVLDGGGYGTQSMRNALVVLGAAGACLAAGIATIIWDIAKRYER